MKIEGEAGAAQRRLVVELSGEGALSHSAFSHTKGAADSVSFLRPELFGRILREAREAGGVKHVTLTGSAPTLHPQLTRILEIIVAEDLTASLLLDGDQVEAFFAIIASRRELLTHICFRLDGPNAAAHDKRRGSGSFKRLVSAFTRCRAASVPFSFLFEITTEMLPHLEQAALLAARLGAASLIFRLEETSLEVEEVGRSDEDGSALVPPRATRPPSADERNRVADEIATLARVFKMKIGFQADCPGTDNWEAYHAADEPYWLVEARKRLEPCRLTAPQDEREWRIGD